MPSVTIEEIEQARDKISGLVRQTPLVKSRVLDEIYLKLDHHQTTGSFKRRV